MEDAESWDTQYHKKESGIEYLEEILRQQIRKMEDPIGRHTAEHDDQTVDQQDAPIRQCVLGEIPV